MRVMDDLISRQAAIDALNEVSEHYTDKGREWHPHIDFMVQAIEELPSAQPTIEAEPVRYCRECKWSWCQIFVDKYGKNKTYWKCLNWDGETDEEGYCHKWEAKMGEEE